MTDYEIMLADSEYWAGCIGGNELIDAVGEEAGFARIAYLESEWGKYRDAENANMNSGAHYIENCEHRSWFSLLIGEAERTNND